VQGLEFYLALVACLVPAIHFAKTLLDTFCGRGKMGIKVHAISCAMCVAALPFFRIPKSLRQAALGGWTCRACGTEIDRRGRVQMQRQAG
jgi:hypothetical protein